MISGRSKVSQYLAFSKCYATNGFVISPREKNNAFLYERGIDFETAKDIVLGLQPYDYVEGPCSNDKDLPGRNDVWVFGKLLQSDDGTVVEAYIKLTISKMANGLGCLCISFHESEYPLSYVFGGEQREIYLLP